MRPHATYLSLSRRRQGAVSGCLREARALATLTRPLDVLGFPPVIFIHTGTPRMGVLAGSTHAIPRRFHTISTDRGARLRGAAPCQKAGAARTLDPVMRPRGIPIPLLQIPGRG